MDVKHVAFLGLFLCACDAPKDAKPSTDPIGTVDVILAGETRQFEFTDVDCGNPLVVTDAHGRILVQAFVGPDEQVGPDSPHDKGAAAYLYDVEYLGRKYDTLMLLAMPVEQGSKTFDCSRKMEGNKTVLTCNNATVRPWFEPGDVPNAAFRLAVECTK